MQNLGNGETQLVHAPAPRPKPGQVQVLTRASLISAGTERMLVEFGRSNLLEKARQQPEKVRQVLDKVRTDGLVSTLESVRSKLAQPIPLGYSNVGIVAAVGAGVTGFRPGDRVVSNGSHADVVTVAANLCARIPDGVPDESAAFTVVASIGLQSLRLAQPTAGEAFVVSGVGLIGLLTVQLLRAHGCRVLALDYDEAKLARAAAFGAETRSLRGGEDPMAAALAFSRGRGVDGVIVAASTRSSDPVTQAARMCRKRGRIVLVGVTGLELNRADFYEKELTFQVSCSYGPGRYDPAYEEQGRDYPVGFVRWTEQRNFEAVLDLMAAGQLDPSSLVTHRFDFEAATEAYAALTDDPGVLGIVMRYAHPDEGRLETTVALPARTATPPSGAPSFAFVGAGNYGTRVLIPAFRAAGARLHTIASNTGVSAAVEAGKSGFEQATTDLASVFEGAACETVVVATRHDSHAQLVARALRAGKHVFVEKPLAVDEEGLALVEGALRECAAAAGGAPQLMVGFNRRFSPHVRRMKELLEPLAEPKCFMMLMNAGAIAQSHWTQDADAGGGRIVGEACHHIDLMRYLAGSPIVSVQARRMGDTPAVPVTEDKAAITLGFEDGSFGTIHYLANGSNRFPKERIEVFAAQRVLQLDNFRSLRGYGWPGFGKMNLWRQDKGQAACVAAFIAGLREGGPAIPAGEILEVARVTLEAARILRQQ
ncbi:bi-domain-containing oxidoreductase [Ramlibacter albus]|nr:bi-domain-containing oxidoreductase [Ramlibacter albus]